MTSAATKPGARRPPIDPRFAQRWIEARREEGRRRLKVLAVLGVVAAVAVVVVGLLYSPAFEVRHVHVSLAGVDGSSAPGGAHPAPATWQPLAPGAGDLARLAGLARHPLMIDVDATAAVRRLDADPWLGDARVARQWPASVTISALTRTPLAVVAMGPVPAPTGYAVIDPTGRVLALSPSAPLGLPVLTLAGPIPGVGGWLTGSPGPGADPALPAARLADTNASSSAGDVPPPTAAALVVLASIRADLRAEITSVSTTPGLSLTLVGPATRGARVQFELGDGSILGAKVSALETLVDQADLSQVGVVDLTVPGRPEASPAGSGPATTAAGPSNTSAGPAAGPAGGSISGSANGSSSGSTSGSTSGSNSPPTTAGPTTG